MSSYNLVFVCKVLTLRLHQEVDYHDSDTSGTGVERLILLRTAMLRIPYNHAAGDAADPDCRSRPWAIGRGFVQSDAHWEMRTRMTNVQIYSDQSQSGHNMQLCALTRVGSACMRAHGGGLQSWIRHLCRSIHGSCTPIEPCGNVYQQLRKWNAILKGSSNPDWTLLQCPGPAIVSRFAERCVPYFFTAIIAICKSQ